MPGYILVPVTQVEHETSDLDPDGEWLVQVKGGERFRLTNNEFRRRFRLDLPDKMSYTVPHTPKEPNRNDPPGHIRRA